MWSGVHTYACVNVHMHRADSNLSYLPASLPTHEKDTEKDTVPGVHQPC